LAAPIVLGSLVSKPVLGSSWYNCTVSGIMSGNLSSPGDADCSTAGKSRSDWLLAGEWPGDIEKGGLPDETCAFGIELAAIGDLFNGFGSGVGTTGGLAEKFFYVAVAETSQSATSSQTSTSTVEVTNCNLVTSPSAQTAPASLHQVLASTSSDPLFVLGQATVVSLLNYYDDPSNYPVTAHTIIAMFNATCNGGNYYVNSTHYWTPPQVLAYLTSLYPPG